MGRFTKAKKEEGEVEYPKLNKVQLQEITELYIRFGSINRILKHWNAVNLDEEGKIVSVCDFTEWYSRSDHNQDTYSKFEAIKGVKYMGQGFFTYMPFSWCSEWLATWSAWIVREAERGDIQALSLMSKKKFSTGKIL